MDPFATPVLLLIGFAVGWVFEARRHSATKAELKKLTDRDTKGRYKA